MLRVRSGTVFATAVFLFAIAAAPVGSAAAPAVPLRGGASGGAGADAHTFYTAESDSGACWPSACGITVWHEVYVTDAYGCAPHPSGYHCHLTYTCGGTVSGYLASGQMTCQPVGGGSCTNTGTSTSCGLGPSTSYYNIYAGTCLTFTASGSAAAVSVLFAYATPDAMLVCLDVGASAPHRV